VFKEERLNKVLKLLEENGRVTVKEAMEFLDVSADTIRRDFSHLSGKGLVFRTHGGIMSTESVSFDPGMAEKVVQHQSEKESIAKKTAELIHDSEVLIIDPGTTTEGIVKYLGEKKNLTVLTNALNIAVESVQRGINTIIMGGVIRQSVLSIIGPDAIEMIRHYQADKLIMGVSGLSLSKGLMTPNRMEAEIKKELIKVANQVIIVADHSKLHKTALCSFGSLKDIDVLVTDSGVDEDLIKRLKEYEIEVILAD
jgi:DeoR family transcriptional regulator, fructose operon transcriptional repressor